jgi:DNA repair protein RadA/Sms
MPSKTPARPVRPAYVCAECGWTTAKWAGRCGECQAWGTIAEAGSPVVRTTVPAQVREPARPIAEVDVEAARATPTGVDEFDRVLGGGLVPGAVVLMAGEPGVGKSTLLLDAASRVASSGRTVLYVTAEESAAQVRLRAERIGALRPRLLLTSETDLATVLGHVEQSAPDLLVVDSVQTVASGSVEGAAGGVTQVREVAGALIAAAKRRAMSTLLVGHVTKDGSIAGPRTLEHLVDVVCQFEGERHSRLRLLRAVKNRYGPTDEVGCFDLSEDGIAGLADPSMLFVSSTTERVPGTCITVTLEGRRPLLAELQALVASEPAPGSARRVTSGLESSRIAMVLAVLQRRLGLKIADKDRRGREADRAVGRPRRRPGGGQREPRRAPARGLRRRRGGGARRGGAQRLGRAPAAVRGGAAGVHHGRGARRLGAARQGARGPEGARGGLARGRGAPRPVGALSRPGTGARLDFAPTTHHRTDRP